jgi:formylglycine-generating enzyme required for sulfatase activity
MKILLFNKPTTLLETCSLLSTLFVCIFGASMAWGDVYYDFETAATTPVWLGTTQMVQNTSASHQGANAIAFTGVYPNAYVLAKLPQGTTNVEFYFYDDYGPNPPLYQYMWFWLLEATNWQPFAGFAMLDGGWGTTPPMTMNHYYAFSNEEYSTRTIGPIRTVGWHRFTFAIGTDSVAMSVDATLVFQASMIRVPQYLKVSVGQGGGWGRLDDLSVATGPWPPELSIRVSQIELCWQSRMDAAYQVQYHSELTADQWVDLGSPIPGTDSVICTNDAVSGPPRFYRVVALSTNTPQPNGMVLVPAGSFMMGDAFHEYNADELPVHTVFLSAFYMDQYDVTKGLWNDVYSWAVSHGYSFESGATGKQTSHPAQTMTWYDAVKWCNARSEKEGRTPAYYLSPAQMEVYRSGEVDVANDWVKWDKGYRLPTEAEWEKAARGGASGHRFPWADADTISQSRANYWAGNNSGGYDLSCCTGYHPTYAAGGQPYTSPVGSFAANGYGLYDITGNVQQWCWDWKAAYSSSPLSDPRGPDAGSYRAIRGGSWSTSAQICRVAYRYSANVPTYKTFTLGFRCVLPLGQ